ncbi:MAG: sulfotransferase family 2 domain-containing protein, partial [Verrucomicrobiota bacterium]
MDDRTVIFLHIPRTAGTTLHTIIDRHYRAGEAYSFGPIAQASLEYLHNLPLEERSRFKMIKGHMGFGLSEKLAGRSTYFTLLREPIDRTVSFFYYIRNDVHHYFHTAIHENEMSLADFIRNRKPLMFDNAQTRLIAGEWLDVPFGRCTPAMLEKAKAHLEDHFSVVGLTEYFDATLLLLQREYGWEHIRYAPQNPARGRPAVEALSGEDLEIVTNFNQYDLALYHHAQNLFQRQLD